ncbi:MAG: FHA domain-containing protein [Thermoanaerobaculia bacterium]|nr:FHA domain-containing protein [Thermoanaerobaculia bacterium]
MTRARLLCRFGSDRGLEFDVEGEATIGRSSGCRVRLDDRSVSGEHARLTFDAGRDAWYLEDLGSLNGTRVDGVPARGRERLERLHLLEFGSSSPLFFVRVEAPPPAEEPPADDRAPGPGAPRKTRVDEELPPVPDVLVEPLGADPGKTAIEELSALLPESLAEPDDDRAPGRRPLLRIAEGAAAGVFPLAEGESLVGRGTEAAVPIPESQISRRHALLRVAGGRVFVRDLESHNHTYLEGERLGSDEVEVRLPARLRFGNIEALLTGPDG